MTRSAATRSRPARCPARRAVRVASSRASRAGSMVPHDAGASFAVSWQGRFAVMIPWMPGPAGELFAAGDDVPPRTRGRADARVDRPDVGDRGTLDGEMRHDRRTDQDRPQRHLRRAVSGTPAATACDVARRGDRRDREPPGEAGSAPRDPPIRLVTRATTPTAAGCGGLADRSAWPRWPGRGRMPAWPACICCPTATSPRSMVAGSRT